MGIVSGANLTQTYTTTEEGNVPALGDVFFAPGGKVYKFVKYSEEAAAVDGVAGEAAYYVADTGVADMEVTSDLSASSEVGAGILQANVSDGEYCWVQIKGPATLSIALSAGADGDPLTATGAADGTLDLTTAVTDVIVAYAIDADQKEILCEFPW